MLKCEMVPVKNSKENVRIRLDEDASWETLRGSLPKSGPLDFATKNTFALFSVGEEALVGVY